MKVIRLFPAEFSLLHFVLVRAPINSRTLNFTEIDGTCYLRVLCDANERAYISKGFIVLRSEDPFKDGVDGNGKIGDYVNSIDDSHFFERI
jgi:hypothetical protein